MANVPITSLPVATSLGPTTDYLEVSKYIGAPGATYQSVRATPQLIASTLVNTTPSGLEYSISNLGSVLLTGVQPSEHRQTAGYCRRSRQPLPYHGICLR